MHAPNNVTPLRAPAPAPQIEPVYLAMAAAQMHAEGRLQAQPVGSESPSQYQHNWNRLAPEAQKQLMDSAATAKTEGERNKYDEFLQEKGTIMLDSAKIFGPKEWQWGKGWPDVDRYDLPDGRVILKRLGNKDLTS